MRSAPPAQLAMRCALIVLTVAVLLALVFPGPGNLTAVFLNQQDLRLLALGLVLVVACGWHLLPRNALLSPHRFLLPGAALALLLVCYAGHYLVLNGYDMSRDEQMASFDAAVFASGQLVQPLPALWRDHADALNTSFMYPAEARGAWISAYLPLNAAFRALLGDLTSPLFTALGLIALWGCVRRIWPEERELPLVATLLYLGSGQIVINGMTSYAMSGHLALSMVWLWLFLRSNWRGDLLALAVGFIATGLHQPLTHPMFAAPILFLCLLDRQWPRAAFFLIGYALIGAFWLWWPGWSWGLVQASADAAQPAGVDYMSRLIKAMTEGYGGHLPKMLANLLRFIAWQHLLLLPLLALGIVSWRSHRLIVALAAGIGLTVIVMLVILPYQGHGFGYRYLHALIGNALLIALFGWKQAGDALAQWRPLLIRTTIAGLAVILPLQAWMAHRLSAPYAAASERIAILDADYAVVDPAAAPFVQDLVINRPDLSNRPVRLDAMELTPQLAALLCRDHARVALLGNGAYAGVRRYYGWPQGSEAAKRNARLTPMLKAAGCGVGVVG